MTHPKLLAALALTQAMLLSLPGCPTAPDPDPDPGEVSPPYGPENSWYHARIDQLPEGLAGTEWRQGEVVPNLRMTDQHGDSVELYQFFGRTIILDAAGEWCNPCHVAAPYIDALWEEILDEAVVITVLLHDSAYNPADADAVERWVTQHDNTGPVAYLDEASFASLDPAVTSYPTLMVIDPAMRMGIPNMQDTEDPWIEQIIDRLRFEVGAKVGDDEVCDDGVDNDMNTDADCMQDSCQSEAACALSEFTETLTPCGPYSEGGGVDIWTVEVTDGVAQVLVDTVSADTVFEPLAYAQPAGGDWQVRRVVGDDEMDCTFPTPTFSCAEGWLRPGTYELMVGAGTGGEALLGDCANPDSGSYALRFRGNVTATLQSNDVASPF